MRVIFLRHPMSCIGGTGVFTLEIIRQLRQAHHIVALWPTDRAAFLDELRALKVECLPMVEPHVKGKFGLVVIQNSDTLLFAHQVLKQLHGVPHIFIGHSSSPRDHVVPYPELFRVLTIAQSLTATHQEWGVPPEIVDVLPNPVSLKPEKFRSVASPPYRLLHLSRLAEDRADVVRQIIAAVNQMPDCVLTIAGDGPSREMLIRSANRNVKFIGEVKSPQSVYRNADLVIGSGRTAAEALVVGRPFIVVGRKGFGGFVDRSNYDKFRKTMFIGRHGGRLYEPILPELLVREIKRVVRLSNLENIVRQNRQLASRDFLSDCVAEKTMRIFQEVVDMSRLIVDDRGLLALKPKIVSNIEIVRHRNGESVIVRQPLSKILMRVDTSKLQLLGQMDGNKTVEQLEHEVRLPRSQTIESVPLLVRELWDKKIIVFVQ